MKEVKLEELTLKAVNIWKEQWLLLTAGTMEDNNMMTVAWGSIGCMWNKPFAQIVVRPQRYTMEYLEKSDCFTLCAFPEKFKKNLLHLGTVSGRDGNKLADTPFTLKKSSSVLSPCYEEASLILECKKMYAQNMDPSCFVTDTATKVYPEKDFHRIYYGEILKAFSS